MFKANSPFFIIYNMEKISVYISFLHKKIEYFYDEQNDILYSRGYQRIDTEVKEIIINEFKRHRREENINKLLNEN